jgi:hypothetical protein
VARRSVVVTLLKKGEMNVGEIINAENEFSTGKGKAVRGRRAGKSGKPNRNYDRWKDSDFTDALEGCRKEFGTDPQNILFIEALIMRCDETRDHYLEGLLPNTPHNCSDIERFDAVLGVVGAFHCPDFWLESMGSN